MKTAGDSRAVLSRRKMSKGVYGATLYVGKAALPALRRLG